MGKFDPVPWDVVEDAIGAPAREITAYVEEMDGEVQTKAPYGAVKTIHDALAEADVDRTVPGLGDPFVTAYLLEKHGILDPEDEATGEYRSLVDRRPSGDRLEALFWEDERTLWWIGVLTGVHPSLVTYWLYEDDIPLMERNYTAESMERIRAYRDTQEE